MHRLSRSPDVRLLRSRRTSRTTRLGVPSILPRQPTLLAPRLKTLSVTTTLSHLSHRSTSDKNRSPRTTGQCSIESSLSTLILGQPRVRVRARHSDLLGHLPLIIRADRKLLGRRTIHRLSSCPTRKMIKTRTCWRRPTANGASMEMTMARIYRQLAAQLWSFRQSFRLKRIHRQITASPLSRNRRGRPLYTKRRQRKLPLVRRDLESHRTVRSPRMWHHPRRPNMSLHSSGPHLYRSSRQSALVPDLTQRPPLQILRS